jgi:hypothetical protein
LSTVLVAFDGRFTALGNQNRALYRGKVALVYFGDTGLACAPLGET